MVMVEALLTLAALVTPAEAAPQTLKGTLEIVHGDDFSDHSKHSHTHGKDEPLPNLEYWLKSATATTRLEFATPPALPFGTHLTVTGEQRGNSLAVSSYRVEAAPGGSKGGKPRGGTTPNYSGGRDTLILLMRFSTTDVATLKTSGELRDESFTGAGSSNAYFTESSLGQAWLKGKNDGLTTDKDAAPGDVTEWLTISGSTSNCDYSGWGSAGRSAAQAAGWDLTGYEHIVHVFPRTTVCQWGGLGQIGGTYTWINGAQAGGTSRSFVISHEIGHNLTLYHSRSLECTANGVRISFANNCSYVEYGDVYEIMGNGAFQLNARNKPHLGWIPPANILTVTSGTHTLYPIESNTPTTAERQILRIQRSSSDYLYVEARAAQGFFDSLLHETGALLHTGADPSANGNSYLIDGSPDTDTQNDAAFQEGQAFVDSVARIYVEVTAVDAATGAVTVLVKTGYTNVAPTASSAPGAEMTVGTAYTHEGTTAADVDKNLNKYEWSWASCSSTCPALSNTKGALSGGSDDVPGPTFTPTTAGTYRLSLKVWDANGLSSTITIDKVAVAPPPLV